MVWLHVAAGGACGALLRFGLVAALPTPAGWPLGNWLANVLGCGLAGFAVGSLLVLAPSWRAFLLIGCLGAVTTMSSFCLETVTLWERGQSFQALAYGLATPLMSLLATWMGLAAARVCGAWWGGF